MKLFDNTDTELQGILETIKPIVDDTFQAMIKHLDEDDVKKVDRLMHAFSDLGIEHEMQVKVGILKKTIDDLDRELKLATNKSLIEIETKDGSFYTVG